MESLYRYFVTVLSSCHSLARASLSLSPSLSLSSPPPLPPSPSVSLSRCLAVSLLDFEQYIWKKSTLWSSYSPRYECRGCEIENKALSYAFFVCLIVIVFH